MTRASRRIAAAVLAFELLLALTPVIPATARIWRADSPQAFYATLATFVGVQFTILTAVFAVIVSHEAAALRDKVGELVDRSPGAVIKLLRDDAFYPHFRRAVEAAEHSVRIAYFAPGPPLAVADALRREYYDAIAARMRRDSRVRYKRLVRSSPENDRWVAGLVRTLRGRLNVDLALLRDLPPDVDNPLALSIQIVDSAHTWLVAVGSHERDGEFRDLSVGDPKVAQAMTAYYNRLWAAADEVLKAGVVTPAGDDLLDRHLPEADPAGAPR